MAHKPVVGLIGGMGSGKSQVAAAFAQRGGHVLPADQFGHEALRQPDICACVRQRWGHEVLDKHGAVDRRKLGARVFANPAERRALEELVFPWIEHRCREEIVRAEADPTVRLIVLDAAILLEAGWNKVCDWLVYIHAPRELRLQRLAEQRGWSAKEVTAREQAQLSLTAKVSRADYALDNSGSLAQLAQQVDTFLHLMNDERRTLLA